MTERINLKGKTYAEEYVDKAFSYLTGKTIFKIRALMPEEVELFAWEHSRIPPYLIIFTDGTMVVPSCDEEGNEAGFLMRAEG